MGVPSTELALPFSAILPLSCVNMRPSICGVILTWLIILLNVSNRPSHIPRYSPHLKNKADIDHQQRPSGPLLLQNQGHFKIQEGLQGQEGAPHQAHPQRGTVHHRIRSQAGHQLLHGQEHYPQPQKTQDQRQRTRHQRLREQLKARSGHIGCSHGGRTSGLILSLHIKHSRILNWRQWVQSVPQPPQEYQCFGAEAGRGSSAAVHGAWVVNN